MLKKFFLLKNFQKNFLIQNDKKRINKILKEILNDNIETIKSLSGNYKNSYKKEQLKKFKKNFLNYRLIGMGGSILGAKAIYCFLKNKINKKFTFVDNLQNQQNQKQIKTLNLVISKSGNTIETIVNSNILLKKKDKNIFITENKKNYLHILAKKLKSEIIYHNNFIGGRYSVCQK